MPVLFGFTMVRGSYNSIFMILILCTTISFILSFKLKMEDEGHDRIKVVKFLKKFSDVEDRKFMKLMISRAFLRGLSSFGVISTLVVLLTFKVVNNEFSLGQITSIVTALSIITTYMASKIKRQNFIKMFLPLSIMQFLVILVLTLSIAYLDTSTNLNILLFSLPLGMLLVWIYNLVNGLVNPIFDVASNTIYFEVMGMKGINKEDQPSYIFLLETAITVSRSIGYAVLLLVSLIGFNVGMLTTLILIFSLMYIAFAYTLKKINQEYLIDKKIISSGVTA